MALAKCQPFCSGVNASNQKQFETTSLAHHLHNKSVHFNCAIKRHWQEPLSSAGAYRAEGRQSEKNLAIATRLSWIGTDGIFSQALQHCSLQGHHCLFVLNARGIWKIKIHIIIYNGCMIRNKRTVRLLSSPVNSNWCQLHLWYKHS